MLKKMLQVLVVITVVPFVVSLIEAFVKGFVDGYKKGKAKNQPFGGDLDKFLNDFPEGLRKLAAENKFVPDPDPEVERRFNAIFKQN